jgi:Flp pilus assembly pilin Flp
VLPLLVFLRSALRAPSAACRGDRGQATAEYALVLVGVAALALLVLAWATKTDKVGDLLDGVFDKILSSAT